MYLAGPRVRYRCRRERVCAVHDERQNELIELHRLPILRLADAHGRILGRGAGRRRSRSIELHVIDRQTAREGRSAAAFQTYRHAGDPRSDRGDFHRRFNGSGRGVGWERLDSLPDLRTVISEGVHGDGRRLR